MANLTGHSKGYDGDQKVGGFKVKNGTYHLVGCTIQRRTTTNGAPSIRFGYRVLRALDEANKDAVGSDFKADYWSNIEKPANAQRLAYLLLAHGADESVLADVDIESDAFIVKHLTGIPFAAQIEIRERPSTNGGKPFVDVEVVKVKSLTPDTRKRYTEAPDWATTIGKPDARVEEPHDGRKNSRGGSRSSGNDNGGGSKPTDDGQGPDPWGDDLPF